MVTIDFNFYAIVSLFPTDCSNNNYNRNWEFEVCWSSCGIINPFYLTIVTQRAGRLRSCMHEWVSSGLCRCVEFSSIALALL